MKKMALIIISLVILIMGVLAFIPGITLGTEPVWHSIVKIGVGLIGFVIGILKDKE